MKEPMFVFTIVNLTIEALGYMALKRQFKEELIIMVEEEKESKNTIETIKYLMMLSVQSNESLQLLSSIVFFILNMVRSEDYDVMIPSLTLKIND